jgi:hypothetical protein
LIGLALRPSETRSANSARVCATPPPWPPRVKAGRTIAGSPMSSITRSASPIEWTIAERGTRRPAFSIVSRNTSRSSARRIAS